MLIWNWVVKDRCLLGWSDLVVWYGGDGLIWWSDGCRVWGWSGVVLGFGGLIWGGSGWLLWSFSLVWWSTLEVCLRKMVWSEYWKLKRWEAELIVVNGSIREKRDWCTRKVGEKKIVNKKAWEKIPTFLKLPSPTLSFPVSLPCPPPPAPTPPASYSLERPLPILPIKFFVHFRSTRSVKPFFILFLLSTFVFKSLSVYSH